MEAFERFGASVCGSAGCGTCWKMDQLRSSHRGIARYRCAM